MSEFKSEVGLRNQLSQMEQRQRGLKSRDKSCEVCRVKNPHLLRSVTVRETDQTLSTSLLCHNHAGLLNSLNKKYFGETAAAQKRANQTITIPRQLVDQFRLEYGIRWNAESVEICRQKMPSVPKHEPLIGTYKQLKQIIARQMQIDPYSPYPPCACYICGEARPILIEVHHKDRGRNSGRAVFLCKNHHTLVTQIQEHRLIDERAIDNPAVLLMAAAELGDNVLDFIKYDYRLDVSNLLKDRYDSAKSIAELMRTPPEDDQCDQDFSIV